jgi:hypothetical protein
VRVAYIITGPGLFSADIAHPGHFSQLFLRYLSNPDPYGKGQEPYLIKTTGEYYHFIPLFSRIAACYKDIKIICCIGKPLII